MRNVLKGSTKRYFKRPELSNNFFYVHFLQGSSSKLLLKHT